MVVFLWITGHAFAALLYWLAKAGTDWPCHLIGQADLELAGPNWVGLEWAELKLMKS